MLWFFFGNQSQIRKILLWYFEHVITLFISMEWSCYELNIEKKTWKQVVWQNTLWCGQGCWQRPFMLIFNDKIHYCTFSRCRNHITLFAEAVLLMYLALFSDVLKTKYTHTIMRYAQQHGMWLGNYSKNNPWGHLPLWPACRSSTGGPGHLHVLPVES